MRIVIGGMSHESNTFNPIITGAEDFVVSRGDELLEAPLPPGSPLRGIVDTLREGSADIVPLLWARAVPNGVVSGSFYTAIKEACIRRLQEALSAGPVDGICLALHGSMKVEGLGCAEGDLIQAVRSLLPDPPLTLALDMHATITPELLGGINGLAGYQTAPHVDCAETGARAARMLREALRQKRGLYTACRKVPLLIAGEKSESAAEPMKSLLDACRRLEGQEGVMAASLLLGFPWADDEHNGVSVVVSVLGDGADRRRWAEEAAGKLAADLWARRRDFAFRTEYYSSSRALEIAYEAALEGGGPVFVSDSGDNPTAGAAGDATELLEALLPLADQADRLPTPLLYSGFYDVPAAAACTAAGVGAELDLTLGGNWDRVNGRKIPLRLRVLAVVRNYGPFRADLILAARRNIHFVITSRHIGFGDEALLPALGLDVARYCLVVVKLGYLEPCFRSVARRAILALSKGCSNEALETIPYRKVRRPLFPLDREMEWSIDGGV